MERWDRGPWPPGRAQFIDRIRTVDLAFGPPVGQMGQEAAGQKRLAQSGRRGDCPQTGGRHLVFDDGPLDAVGRNRRPPRPEGEQDHHQRRPQRTQAFGQNAQGPSPGNLRIAEGRQSLRVGSNQEIRTKTQGQLPGRRIWNRRMTALMEDFQSAVARPAPLPVRTVGFSAWVLYPPGCAQEGSLFQGFPTWRYRVLKTALRLRPRRALSSAPGQNSIVAQNYSQMKNCSKILKLLLTNHIPVFRGSTFLCFLFVPLRAFSWPPQLLSGTHDRQ